MGDKIKIISLKGREAEQVYELEKEQLVHIGRGSQNEINFSDLSISRNHLLLNVNPPHIAVEQCKGKNDTYLIRGNKEPQLIADQSMPLQNGDIIRFVYPDTRCVAEVGIQVILEPKAKKIQKEEKIESVSSNEDSIFLLGRELDTNSTGTAYLIKKKDTGRFYAFKEIFVDESDKVAMQILKRELNVARRLSHKNIAKIYSGGRLINGLNWGILTEYATEGTVAQFLKKNRVTEQEAVQITIQILKALEYAHKFEVYTLPQELQDGRKNGIVHGNINPNTVLLHKKGNELIVKVADFGFEKAFRTPLTPGFQLYTPKYDKDLVTTSYFMPKHQFFQAGILRPEDDVFSTIALLYYMLTGEYVRPYKNDSFVFFEGPVRPIQTVDPSVTPKLAEIIDAVLSEKKLSGKMTAQNVRIKLEKYYDCK